MKPCKPDSLTAAQGSAACGMGKASVPKDGQPGKARGIRQICRQLFGIPDYERYRAHAAARHPDAPLLSRREFFAQAIERKYGKSVPRCC